MPFRRLPPVMSLRAFEAVARHGSFKAAAEELSVTPGALSQQVKNLETHLGISLLVRGRKIATTPAGEQLKLGLVESFNLMRSTVDSITTQQNAQQLLVTCGPPFASKWLAQRLPAFLSHHASFDVRVNSSADENQAQPNSDVSIVLSEKQQGVGHSEPIAHEVTLAVASPAFIERHQLREPRDLLRVPLLTEESLLRFQLAPTWREWFSAANIGDSHFNRGLNFGVNAEQAIDAALSGAGVLFTRRTLASFDIASGRLKGLFDIKIDTPFYYSLVCSPHKAREAKVGVFVDWLKSAFYEQHLV